MLHILLLKAEGRSGPSGYQGWKAVAPSTGTSRCSWRAHASSAWRPARMKGIELFSQGTAIFKHRHVKLFVSLCYFIERQPRLVKVEGHCKS